MVDSCRTINVQQDGADFYVFFPDDHKLTYVSYPSHVRDFDMEAATKARSWFYGWCRERGFNPVWEK